MSAIDKKVTNTETATAAEIVDNDTVQLDGSTYDIIRQRLESQSADMRQRLEQLNRSRREVFGAIPTELVASERITTDNNCVARDLVSLGNQFLFGYNVHLGLKSETSLSDVFAVYSFRGLQNEVADAATATAGSLAFHAESLDLLRDKRFETDFQQVFRYYKHTRFSKFLVRGPYLYMVFQVGKSTSDIKAFKWQIDQADTGDVRLTYVDARSEHEVRLPTQHEFEWTRCTLDSHRKGAHPHVSIEDRIFVETVDGDLTIKVEDNTDSGRGIYAEDVIDPDQGLGDAEIFYAIIDNLIALKIRPYQEDAFRYILYNDKLQEARRVDAMERACVLLPAGHGVIFSNGYYLQTGEHKSFDGHAEEAADLHYDRRLPSPNGEDHLYVFNNATTGEYVLLSYNVIEQQVATPIVCHGYSLFDNGHLVFFKTGHEPQRNHTLQIWQTPYVGERHIHTTGDRTQQENYLFKIGNQDIVRGMADCYEVLALTAKEDSYANLYHDVVRKTANILDTYFWMESSEAGELGQSLRAIQQTATAAIDEYEKVVRVRRETQQKFAAAEDHALSAIQAAKSKRFEHIDDYVATLADLRRARGEVVGLRSLRAIDMTAVDQLESSLAEQTERLSHACVEFLLGDDALTPYADRVAEQRSRVESVTKVTDANELATEMDASGEELDMLIEVVSNLKIDDATHRTEIIDTISAIYAHVNQAKAALKKQTNQLMTVEGEAEFHSQIKLLEQGLVNYLDVCDTAEKCDEYLTKLMVQIEELEGRFAEFPEFLTQLADKRQDVYSTFDGKRVALVEQRNRRATSLVAVADRVLKGIENRVTQLDDIQEIHSYFAADLMVEKVRNLVEQLAELGDTVKVDEVQSRLKTVQEDAVRQLKDRQELYVDGDHIIQLGRHKFSVNQQPLDLTTVVKNGDLHYHLTGTNYLEAIASEELLATRAVWELTSPAESADVYRAEYLAYTFLQQHPPSGRVGRYRGRGGREPTENVTLLSQLQSFMQSRHGENYVKGVHDHDAALIARALLDMRDNLGLLRFATDARALAGLVWMDLARRAPERYAHFQAEVAAADAIHSVFGGSPASEHLLAQARDSVRAFVDTNQLFRNTSIDHAAAYMLATGGNKTVPVADSAASLATDFINHLKETRLVNEGRETNSAHEQFTRSLQRLRESNATVAVEFRLIHSWLTAYTQNTGAPWAVRPRVGVNVKSNERANANLNLESIAPGALRPTVRPGHPTGESNSDFLTEAAALLLRDPELNQHERITGNSTQTVSGLLGDHRNVVDGEIVVDYTQFMTRLDHHRTQIIPMVEQYQQLKKQLVDDRRAELRLDEFKPRVLTSFVRNRLIDEVYLPLIGDNLAKQIGVAGEGKRTDLMGLLLLVSPPGYGKTTLMEYVANRLGITFMKINGPAIGHHVTSLDPAEAPNAGAREEIEKLNLALEMGDNVMIYVDDIQHCNPEFLQKFISLCDGQRKIEGVFRGQTRRYDLRGRKVVVVMAGNPYTESGQKFQIPDMLASRADTYNLGDVTGNYRSAFELSYLENALTSNPALRRLANASQQDVRNVIQLAEASADGNQPAAMTATSFDGDYSPAELAELTSVLSKLIAIRSVVLQVNEQYIHSAAQADEYRTEPAFRLQGSYRDMNKMAEAVAPIMNDEEVASLIRSHYENQAQTLTGDAEANLLKLSELQSTLNDEDSARWEDIKSTFARNLLLGAAGDDTTAQIIAQLSTFTEGLAEIRSVLADGLQQLNEREHIVTVENAAQNNQSSDLSESGTNTEIAGNADTADSLALATIAEQLTQFNSGIRAINASLNTGMQQLTATSNAPAAPIVAPEQHVNVVHRIPRAFLDIIQTQFTMMESWMAPVIELCEQSNTDTRKLRASMEHALGHYQKLIATLEKTSTE